LLAAQPRLDLKRLRELAGTGVDWQALLDLAAWHRVRPVAYEKLRQACWDLLPTDLQRAWQYHAKALAQRALFGTGALLKIAAQFEKEQIPVVPLKGPALAQALYGDIASREFVDLDLLVKEADFVRAVAALQPLGYRTDWDLAPVLQLNFLRYQGECTLSSTRGWPPIDLHWRLAAQNNALPLDAASCWPRFRPVQFEGRTLLGFAPEDLTLYIASQGGHDEWRDLRRLCDLAALIARYPELDWNLVMREASRLHGLRVLLLGLSLARELIGASLPDEVQGKIRDDHQVLVFTRQIMGNIAVRVSSSDLQRSLFQIRVKERPRDKIRLGFIILTGRTHFDGQWIMLPKVLWPLYRVLRPLRQFIKVTGGWASSKLRSGKNQYASLRKQAKCCQP
jgi:hypothetical protein